MFDLIPYSRKKNRWLSDFDAFLDGFARIPFFDAPAFSPIRADVKDVKDAYVIEAELPGVCKDNITIDINNDVLTLGVKDSLETDKEQDGYIYKERQQKSCKRSFYLKNINADQIKAKYKNGILSITLPKLEPNNKTKTIAIE